MDKIEVNAEQCRRILSSLDENTFQTDLCHCCRCGAELGELTGDMLRKATDADACGAKVFAMCDLCFKQVSEPAELN